jgi:hypothetical protein
MRRLLVRLLARLMLPGVRKRMARYKRRARALWYHEQGAVSLEGAQIFRAARHRVEDKLDELYRIESQMSEVLRG